jgi:AraC-like DNA-binding protein
MRCTVQLAAGDGFVVSDLRIREQQTAWSEPEMGTAYRLVFVRGGVFRLRLDGWDGVADPVTAYLGRPGDEQSIAHRPGTEDACTVVTLDEGLARETIKELDDDPSASVRPMLTTGQIDLAQRVLAARARQGADGFELAERVVRLAAEMFPGNGAAALSSRRSGIPSSGAPSRSRLRRRLADSARERLASDPVSLGLGALAQELFVSRSHLSRVFSDETGETLTRFRNRLRVRLALDRIEAGETSLARLAAELGFADHAHLTRTMRAEVGSTPHRVRKLLATGRD